MISPPALPVLMGIINVTPDSFSGDGVVSIEGAVDQARRMLADGASLLDIGGESSRPGATPVSLEEELGRVVPTIAAIRAACGDVTIAVDTVKAAVAAAALDAGASIINDITALRGDPAMAGLVAQRGCRVVLMHNRSDRARVHNDSRLGPRYDSIAGHTTVADVIHDLRESANMAQQAGIATDKIILDPGLGFGKSLAQNLALIRQIPDLKALGYPVLIAPSRKSFIGQVLDAPIDERLEGTAATIALATFLGADILRVHDVQFMARVAKMAAALR